MIIFFGIAGSGKGTQAATLSKRTGMSETQLAELVKAAVAAVTAPTMADMGRIIGEVKARAGVSADGATIARLVKQALES